MNRTYTWRNRASVFLSQATFRHAGPCLCSAAGTGRNSATEMAMGGPDLAGYSRGAPAAAVLTGTEGTARLRC